MKETTKKKILILEDEKPLAHALELKLTHEGFDVVTTDNGETGLSILEKEKFDLVQLCREVMDSMKLQFEQQNTITTIETSGENFIIEADKLHMTSVIYNLLDNALKYSKQNPNIKVHVIDQSQYLEMRVSDHGIGIAGEYKSKIFEQFFRVPGGDRHNIKGYGLGLSYVNHIIQRHQGFIEVESELGKGSTFITKIPFKEAQVIYYDKGRRVRKITLKL